MKRRNDALIYGRRDRYQDHWFGDARGPSNINNDIIKELNRLGKLNQSVDLDNCADNYNIKYAAMYLGSIKSYLEANDPSAAGVPESYLGLPLTINDRQWIKAISLYNSYDLVNYSYGEYSDEITAAYLYAQGRLK